MPKYPQLARSVVASLALAITAGSAAAQSAPVPLDSAAVRHWVDSVVVPALKISGLPGAIVVVARRERILLNVGYGTADLEAGTPVDPNVTLFQLASIGKSMTAAIAAELIDEGVLDPKKDVNQYLKSGHVSGYPVTLDDLLGHRGGFDDDITGLLTPFDSDIGMRPGELDRRLRALVRPGMAAAYDNQGFGVVGLILRDVTGKSIPELYRERLFGPVGMTSTVHGRPADGKARLARCYTVQGPGKTHLCESWLYREGMMGAGGVLSTGADMGRYLRMLLNDGSIDGQEVLTPRAFADLTNFSHARFHPGMPGGGYSLIQFEEFRGLEYAHSGSMPGFSSMMKIYPDADVAILVSFMGGQPPAFELTISNVVKSLDQVSMSADAKPGLQTMQMLTETFAERFIPADRPRASEGAAMWQPSEADPIDDYLGKYVIASNHSRTYVSNVGGWTGLVTLERGTGDNLRIAGFAELGEYHEVGPLLYENAKRDRIALAKTPVGRMLAIGLSGGIFKQTNLIESPAWSPPVFLISLVLLLTALIQLRPKAAPSLRKLAGWSLIGLVLVFGSLLAEWQWGVEYGIVKGSILVPAIWRVALHVGAGLLAWQAVGFFRKRDPMGKIALGHGVLIGLAGIALVIVVLSWRVIGAFPPYFTW